MPPSPSSRRWSPARGWCAPTWRADARLALGGVAAVGAGADVLAHEVLERLELLEGLLRLDLAVARLLAQEIGRGIDGRAPGGLLGVGVTLLPDGCRLRALEGLDAV